jgi:hypothetical protein
VISGRGLNVRPVEDDPRALQIMGYGNGLPAAAPTHWSFGQLCSLASPGHSPASYFREMSNGMQSGPRIGMQRGPLTGIGAGLSR